MYIDEYLFIDFIEEIIASWEDETDVQRENG